VCVCVWFTLGVFYTTHNTLYAHTTSLLQMYAHLVHQCAHHHTSLLHLHAVSCPHSLSKCCLHGRSSSYAPHLLHTHYSHLHTTHKCPLAHHTLMPTCLLCSYAHLLIMLLCPLVHYAPMPTCHYALMPTCSLCPYAHLLIMLLCPLVIMLLCPLAHCALMPTCSPHFHHTHFAHLCTTFTPHSLCSYAHLHTTHCAHLHTTLTPHSPCSNAHLLHTHCAHLHTTLTPHSPCSDAHSLIMLLCPLAHHTYSTPIMLSCPLAHHNIIIMPTCTPQLHHHAHLHTTTTSLCPLAHHNYMYYTGLCIVAHCLSAVHNQCNALTCTHHPPHKYTYSA